MEVNGVVGGFIEKHRGTKNFLSFLIAYRLELTGCSPNLMNRLLVDFG